MSPTRQLVGELISEALAVCIIITLGCSAAAMLILYDPSPYQNAYWGVCIAWGMAVTLAIYVTANVSGTHANPAVTLALALYRGFAWKKVPLYWAAQLLGGFLGAILVYTLFQPVIDAYNQTHSLTRSQGGAGGVFFTSPGYMITPIRAFFNEIILTAILLLGIFAITEEFNEMTPGANAGAFMIGMLIAAIGASAGYLEGWPLNPARDFGPRLFAYFAGWGEAALPAPHDYWWVPIAGPMIGGVIGAGIYQYLVWPYLPRNRTPQDEQQ